MVVLSTIEYYRVDVRNTKPLQVRLSLPFEVSSRNIHGL